MAIGLVPSCLETGLGTGRGSPAQVAQVLGVVGQGQATPWHGLSADWLA